MDEHPTPILIAGPTASGKSALALEIADAVGGVIVNADSMQVYRDLRIVTARPGPLDESRVPHRLYGHVDAAENYSVGRWLADAEAALAAAARENRRAILVGGTGLYFKALTQGLAAVPTIPPEIRESIRARLAAEGPLALHADLARHDPAGAARLKPADGVRIARALEVIAATGRPLAEWQRHGVPVLGGDVVKLFLVPERAELIARIDARFDRMIADGALDEARALRERGLDPLLPAMKAHGVPWLIKHLEGALALEDATAQAKSDTRRYAKRQLTWFRHQLPGWDWVAAADARDALARAGLR